MFDLYMVSEVFFSSDMIIGRLVFFDCRQKLGR